ncbi:hypothetical protein, conserved [Trypanosoma brucei brucei TREU927]|uniref:Cleft lip and palate transmembrane protein 1 (CLPTM1) n=1 Tax=Trypanosoma brucei brucei (strain 927/4 GUTat10.1) TaxID=185431 RepID=Q38BZ8_TRYB2|nr:hypothetical protein, conserved [Trypanosoma brucei brucei TREU927]EAN77672.1 hypothetical protein, conserved [Trypanosoma brucei brucei TREU927]
MPQNMEVRDDARRPNEKPSWKVLLTRGLLVAFIALALKNLGMFGWVDRGSETVPDVPQHAYYSQKGDTYDVEIMSVEPGLFKRDSFRRIVVGGTEGISRNYTVNLQSCFKRNCSATLKVVMRLYDLVYTQEFPMVRFLPSRRAAELHNLFTENVPLSRDEEETEANTTWKAYFQPVLTLSPVVDLPSPIPPEIRHLYAREEASGKYLPLLYINNIWVLRSHLMELNKTTAEFPLNFTIRISPITSWKLGIQYNFDRSLKQNQDKGLMRSEDAEEIKRIFLETNPYFLALTLLVSILHMFFEYLAMSNDVMFWRRRKDFRGLSLRTIIMNCYSQTVIFLYLYDNDETSWAILLPSGIGVLIEYWKLAQTAHFVRGEGGRLRLQFGDGYDKKTRKHDDVAIRYLMYLLTPVLACYTVYSALFNTHRGWYSFFIGTQVRFIYIFGFAMMTPQIFINYKMKSVAQLPWRTFVYRALNTIIDDLFAFIVTMPLLHRLACLRDDIVFIILLYQRWIYPVDTSRKEDCEADDDDGEERCVGDKGKKNVEGPTREKGD